MNKKYLIVYLLLFVCAASAKKTNFTRTEKDIQAHFQWVMSEVRNPESKNVLVAAHRGDWRNAPENSIQALKNCIDMGVDIVEIDLKKTKDGQLILMHDKTIDRTTTGKGRPEDFTLDSLKTLFLIKEYGVATRHKIPTFEEFMTEAKGKMFICIDKGYPYLSEVLAVLQKTGTTEQVLFNGTKNLKTNKKDYGGMIREINFKPVVNLGSTQSNTELIEYVDSLRPQVVELVFQSDTLQYIQNNQMFRTKGIKLWYNALWDTLCAAHDDDIATEEGRPEDSWGWLVRHGASIIQTDRPYLLLQYLKKRKLHK